MRLSPLHALPFAIAAATLTDAGAGSTPARPYLVAGHEVEGRFRDFAEALAEARRRLREVLERDAPDLCGALDATPKAERPETGYGYVPRIRPEPSPLGDPLPPTSSPYSWPRTRRMIEAARGELESELVEPLTSVLAAPTGAGPRSRYEALVERHANLVDDHRRIDRVIRHNWLWQRAVARNPAPFATGARIHDAVIERAALIQARADATAAHRQSSGSTAADEEAGRDRRIAELERTIRGAGRPPTIPRYLRVERRIDGWLVRVPTYTDIADPRFLGRLERAIERHWCIADRGRELRLDVALLPISAATLYGCTDPDDCGAPRVGDSIDLALHARRFPTDGACITTGADKTHVLGGCIFLGPGEAGSKHLAHEFGHMLGFADQYVRGYRDLGDDGFEILEIVPDSTDLMGSSGGGRVHPYHYRAMIYDPRRP